jgi:hypothetical protein
MSMSTTNCYKVHYHWEQNGKIVNQPQIAYVQAAANDYATLKGVLVTNQSLAHNGATLVIDSALNVGPGNIFQ